VFRDEKPGEAGFVLDGFSEPRLPLREGRRDSWQSYADLPPFLLAHLRCTSSR
jgi:hypothetical protein